MGVRRQIETSDKKVRSYVMVKIADQKKNQFLADIRKEFEQLEPHSEPVPDVAERYQRWYAQRQLEETFRAKVAQAYDADMKKIQRRKIWWCVLATTVVVSLFVAAFWENAHLTQAQLEILSKIFN